MVKKHLIRFVVVGISNTLISYLAFISSYLLIFAENASYSQFFSYMSGIIWSYFWNKNWTFSEKKHKNRTFIPFSIIQVSLMGLSVISIKYAIENYDYNVSLIWFFVMSIITLLNFILTKWVVFKT
jgi:putative flippase GtrA